MSEVDTEFASFIASWRSLRADIAVRIERLRAGALLSGRIEELEEVAAAIDAIVDDLGRGQVAPLTKVYRCCSIVRSGPARDELVERIWRLSATYRHTLFITRPIPAIPGKQPQ